MSIWFMLLLFLIIANLPWIGEKVFFIFAMDSKPVWVRLLELVVYYMICLLIAIGFEQRYAGDVYSQNWEFFVTTFSLFLVLAVPGVVYRYLWLSQQAKYR